MRTKLFSALAGKIKRITSKFRERPTVAVDDYVLEHFLLYNGLVGSAPDNQRKFRDLRADIIEAVNHDSPAELTIALKVPPLWWEDRLEKIFAEIAAVNKKGAIACLLPEGSAHDSNQEYMPLYSNSWQSRANAACMLAFLEATEAVPAIVDALDNVNSEMRPAFCHFALSLGRLRTEQARQALVQHLKNEEPWFRVDAAGALASWALPVVAQDLMHSMLDYHQLQDYTAVVIARKHSPLSFLEYSKPDSDIEAGACEMILALLKAIEGPFHADFTLRALVEECQSKLNQIATTTPTPRTLHAAIALNLWCATQDSPSALEPNHIRSLSAAHEKLIEACLKEKASNSPAQMGNLRHAIALCGQFKLRSCSAHLASLIRENHSLLCESIASAGSIEDPRVVPELTKLIRDRFDLEARSQQALSAHPIFEEDREAALIYWTALQALGMLAHQDALEILLLAVNDYAPDKREQALLSLQNLCLHTEIKLPETTSLTEIVLTHLSDPASSVRIAALTGIQQHKLIDLLPEAFKLLHAKEISVQRKAAATISALAADSSTEIAKALTEAATKEFDPVRKERLMELSGRISSQSRN